MLASVIVSLPVRVNCPSPTVRIWLDGSETELVLETTRTRPEAAPSGTVASTLVSVTTSGFTRMFLFVPRNAT